MIHLSRRVTEDEVYINFCEGTHVLAEVPAKAIVAAGKFLTDIAVSTAAGKEIKFTMKTTHTVTITKRWGALPVVSLSKFGGAYPVKTWRLTDILSL